MILDVTKNSRLELFVTNAKITVTRNYRIVRFFCDIKNTHAHLSGTFGFKGKYLFVTGNGPFKDGNVKMSILLLL